MKFEEWLSQQGGLIEVDCGCVTTESFYHCLRAAYESGNSAQPVTVPDGYVLVPVEPTPEMLTASYVFAHIDNTADSWKAMLAAAPKAPDGWIPVSERMPDAFERVLVTDGFDGFDVMFINGDGSWAHVDELYPGDITHWQPLPDAPKVTP